MTSEGTGRTEGEQAGATLRPHRESLDLISHPQHPEPLMPTSRLAPTLSAAAMIAMIAGSITAQTVPSVNLGKASAKSKYTLGHLFSLQELPDGRVVASDTKEQVFRMVDLNKGDVGIVGKQGDDAESYRMASNILRLPGDSLGLYDPVGRKMLHLTPQGSVAGFVPLPTMSNNRRIGTLIGADQNGSLYFTLPEQFDTATKALVGTTGVTRFSPGADADEPQLTFRTRRADQVKLGGMMPFIFRDAIAIRSDGLMARVVADTYQVVWGRNGKETGRTGPLPFTPIMLSETEQKAVKDSVIEGLKSMMASGPGGPNGSSMGGAGRGSPMAAGAMSGGGDRTVVVMGGGGGAPVMMGSGSGVFVRELTAADAAKGGAGAAGDTKVITNAAFNPADLKFGEFPSYKPPMPQGNNVAMFDANGNLWVARSTVHGDAVPHYDVIAEGKGLIGRVNLPSGTRLLGFGKNVVYLARTEEGSDWLERYTMPKLQ